MKAVIEKALFYVGLSTLCAFGIVIGWVSAVGHLAKKERQMPPTKVYSVYADPRKPGREPIHAYVYAETDADAYRKAKAFYKDRLTKLTGPEGTIFERGPSNAHHS